jgi:uncharacterized protein YbgA (DUF1722 family)/uncharacterized protein YbbK (DUF523 family)
MCTLGAGASFTRVAVPRIGISSCLLGSEVRFDAGHKRDAFLVETFGRHVEWVSVCPELEVGMGVPREPVRLVEAAGALHMRGVRTGADWTGRMERFASRRLRALEGLCGYVFKKDSPSCGVFRVKVFPEGGGPPRREGTGLFARSFAEHFPLVPVEEEGRLHDPRLRENFVTRVFAYADLQELASRRLTAGALVAFHADRKYQLLAHSPGGYRELGQLVARAGKLPARELSAAYAAGFMKALSRPATPARHANVLQHVLGHFKERLSPEDKAEALALIEDHRRGLVPLVVPLTLLAHHVRRLGDAWLRRQSYLRPHPRELMLLNHV